MNSQSGDDASQWTSPQILSVLDNAWPYNITSPRMTSDVNGNLHVIWASWTGEGVTFGAQTDTIFYTQKLQQAEQWSEPIDIVVSTINPQTFQIGDLAATPDGRLIIAWVDGDQLLVSEAQISAARLPTAWITSMIDVGLINRPNLVLDDQGRIFVVYTVDSLQVRVFTINYDDSPSSPPVTIWEAPFGAAVSNPWGCIASNGDLQIVWTENTADMNWSGEAIWHIHQTYNGMGEAGYSIREVARSQEDNTLTLDSPTMLSAPNGALHLFWNNGVSSTTGRFYQWSGDNGLTWSPVIRLFENELSGQTENAGMAVDSQGVLHLVTAAYGPGGTALRYATQFNHNWSDYVTLWGDQYPGEQPKVAITEGNLLHVIWYASLNQDMVGNNTRFAVVYSSKRLAAPYQQPAESFLVETPKPTGIALSTVLPTSVIVPSISPQSTQADPPNRIGLGAPIVSASALSALIVVIVVILRLHYHRRNI